MVLTHEDGQQQAGDERRDPEQRKRRLPAEGKQHGAAHERDEDGADVAAADMGTDGEAATLGWIDVGQERVADRMLRAGADASRADGGEELRDRLRQPTDEEAGSEQDLAAGEERRSRDVARQETVGELHRATDRGGDGDEGADIALVEPVLDDDDRIDERHQRGLGVDHRVGEGEQHEGEPRP